MNTSISDAALHEAQLINELQEKLMDLNNQNISDFIGYLVDSPFIQRIDDLADTILLSFQFRPNKLQLYVNLISTLITMDFNDHAFSKIPQSFLRNFVPSKVKWYYFLKFVQKLNFEKIISNEDLLIVIQIFFQDYSQEIMSNAYILLYFAPLVEANMPDFFNQKCALFTKQLETFGIFFEVKDFLVRLPLLKENNWELFYKQAETNYPLDSIQSIIRNDDIETFQIRAGEPNFDINQETRIHSYENLGLPEVNPTLLQLAAYYGSMKIFKFILLNGANLNVRNREGFLFEHFAIAGGDLEMIRIFEQKECTFNKTLKVAAQFHQNHIFHWIYENKEKDNHVFLDAAAANNLHVVQFFIDNGFDVNYANDEEETALHFAAKFGANDVIRLLLAHPKINVNAGIHNRTPLDVAAISGFTETVSLLLTCPKILTNLPDRNDRTPITNAAHSGNLEVVKLLAQTKGVEIDGHGSSPLQEAIKKDFVHIVEFLLTVNINVDVKDQDENTPLHLAAAARQAGSLRLLLSHPEIQKQVLIRNYDQNSPLHIAAENHSSEWVAALVELCAAIDPNITNKDKLTPVHIAADKGSAKSLRLLLTLPNVNINARDDFGQTPLHYAAKKCSLKHLQILINFPGIDINARDLNGVTPLHLALKFKPSPEGIDFFLSQPNLDFNAADSTGETPLHYACRSIHPECFSYIINRPEVNAFAADNKGQTALHKAARNTKPQALSLLLSSKKGFDVNSKDKDGVTPLHFAATAKESGTVRALLAVEGINVNEVDKNGQTALHYGVKNGNTRIVQALLNAPGIIRDISDNNGQTPIDLLSNKATRHQIENLFKK